MTILTTIFVTCLGLLIIGAFVDGVLNDSSRSNFSETIAFLVAAIAIVTFISILAIGIYTGDIREWFR